MKSSTERILFSMFFDMQSQGYKPYGSAEVAAITSPGKPAWILTREDTGFKEIRDFYNSHIKKPDISLQNGLVTVKNAAMVFAALQGNKYFAREIVSYYLPEPPSGKFFSSGRLRKPGQDDIPMIETWMKSFFSEAMESEISTEVVSVENQPGGDERRECGGALSAPDGADLKRNNYDSENDARAVYENKLYIWQDGIPSAMGMLYTGSAATARINLIYTPQNLRRRGYATAIVRALSEAAFQTKKTPVLYALAENTAANELYKSIGFKEAGRLTEVKFEA